MSTSNLGTAVAFAAPYYVANEKPETQADLAADSLERSFLTAMLLTGSVSMAEAAVLEAIHTQDSAVNTALKPQSPMRLLSLHELQAASNAVPPNLRAVMLLPRLPRQCFVLSILLSMPRRECALLLNISEAEVGSYSGAAASALAYLAV